jgi:hypothetical protein
MVGSDGRNMSIDSAPTPTIAVRSMLSGTGARGVEGGGVTAKYCTIRLDPGRRREPA